MILRNLYIWIIAIIITLASVYYQRITGPSYPLKGEANINGKELHYNLERSHSSSEDFKLRIEINDSLITGNVRWMRYKSYDEWVSIPMVNKDGALEAVIPKQPPAGKILYYVELHSGNQIIPLNIKPVIMRFRGDVPSGILIPHILCMFIMMFLSTRTGLEFFSNTPRYKIYTFLTLAFVIAGGLIMGPITQKFAFGEYWTGVPFGFDLTDNKTLIAFIAWIVALWSIYKSKNPGRWILAAAVITLLVFLIPHSVLGSEIDYRK
jgi:hypothetical protein